MQRRRTRIHRHRIRGLFVILKILFKPRHLRPRPQPPALHTRCHLLYLRLLAEENGLADQMAAERTRDNYWYPRQFKNGFGPQFLELVEADAPSPLKWPGLKPLTLFVLGGLFKGAGQYGNDDLLNALAELGRVETAIRGDMATEALTVWFSKILR